MWTQRYVLRSPANVVDEIELYQRRYGITGVNFYDLTAIIKKEWIIEFCRLLVDRKVNIDWSLPTGTRSEALDEEVVSWLVRTQCRYLAYAPESGSERVQRQVKKRVRMSRLVASMRAATRAGITVRTNMIVGLPDERRMDIWKTLLAIAQFAWIGAEECSVTIYQPYPGNEIFRDLVKRGAITINDAYFENLAMLSTGRLAPARATFSQHLSRFEVTLYRVLGLVLSYALSYMFYPRRVVRTIRNVFRTSNAATVMEQRLKERVRRLRRVGTREAIVAPVRRSVSEKRGVGSP